MSSVLKFKQIEIRNFMSIGNATQIVELDGHDSVFVIGRNLDVIGAKNGCGKTTLINALCYAIFNKPFDNISLQKLINGTNAIKNTLMEVKLVFEKDGSEYQLYRTRGSEIITEITRDGVDITPGKGVYETDAMIVDIIGISYDLFTKTVIFAGSSQPFLQLPIQQQRTLIEELFGISTLSEKAKLLKEQIRNTESDIKVAEAVLQQQLGVIEAYNQQVKDAEQRIVKWDKQREDEIADITSILADLETIDIDAEQALHSKRIELTIQHTEVEAKLTTLKRDKKTIEKAIEKLMSEEEHLAEAKCPYCKQQFADAPEKLNHISDELTRLGDQFAEIETEIDVVTEKSKDLKKQISDVAKRITHNDIGELIEARTNKSVLLEKLATQKTAINPYIEPLERLIEKGVPVIDTSRTDTLRKILDHQNFLLKLLTDKNSFLRRRIISKSTPLLNTRLNKYTADLGLPHIVRFDADMSCTVTEFGRDLDFGNLSAGEKKRVNIAMSLAFRDVIHALHSKINILMIDEIDGGSLDDIGVDAVLHLLHNKANKEEITTFVISHHPLAIGRMDRTLVAEKENGFSSLFFE